MDEKVLNENEMCLLWECNSYCDDECNDECISCDIRRQICLICALYERCGYYPD